MGRGGSRPARCGAGRRLSLEARSQRAEGEGISNPINLRHGIRVTTNDGYPEPARGRPNLTIRGGALVDRVLFEETRACAVRVRSGDIWEEIAAPEIILCAGAIHSPTILMRSGSGPANAR